ncbi:uncharacterized protein LOC110990891 [Acanthaster planci]|uniref:Uncharacterized protein LOC110990891 n=1 Tax=Acanthaster planci TaxID=133434 RepID=A0A8B8A6P3_ACAPL|nr:uncharacterized protein LOC110990891 [Acanthaster planci]
MSGHIHSLQYHGISSNLCYCFVRGKVIPQVKTSEQPYYTWVVLHKETGQVCTAECTCCVGIQATCKHISGLLFAVVEAVEQGKNSSCTSQQQAWGQGPKKGQPVHDCQFAKNIKIVGVKADVTQQTSSRNYRSEFEPRVLAHRNKRPVYAFNIDALADITNGNCGMLMYVKQQADPAHQTPNIHAYVKEEEVETTRGVLTVEEAHQKSSGGSADDVIKELELNHHQQILLANETKKQASSTLWTQHRIGRITASVAGDCAASIKENGLSGHSQIAKVMGYYDSPHSSALTWGRMQEPVARKQYVAWHRLHYKHKGVTCEETGLWVNIDCPYVAASPDGIVRCHVCGDGLLEIKNPYTHRLCEIQDFSTKKGSCLTMENGMLQVRRTHIYYTQVQVQMWCTGYSWTDFIVRTVSKHNNFHAERIQFDTEFIASLKPKLYIFFVQGILKEFGTRSVQNIVRDRSIRKIIDSVLCRVEESVKMNPSASNVTCTYPCGFCTEECESNPREDSRNSIGCDVCMR